MNYNMFLVSSIKKLKFCNATWRTQREGQKQQQQQQQQQQNKAKQNNRSKAKKKKHFRLQQTFFVHFLQLFSTTTT